MRNGGGGGAWFLVQLEENEILLPKSAWSLDVVVL